MFDTASVAHKQWAATGRTIQRAHAALKEQGSEGLKGILIISAHWESESDAIKSTFWLDLHLALGRVADGATSAAVNTTPSPLIYDFYNFPKHYYSQTFPHETLGQEGIAEVGQALDAAGVKWEGVKGRGLDHGAWVPLKVAFPSSNPPPAPLLQISLPRQSSTDQLERSLALGRALAPLLEQGFLILASGQPVHNLRDLGKACPYGGPFLARVGHWLRDSTGEASELEEVRRWPDYKRAVPEDDHFAPVVVALGAGTAFGDKAVVELEEDQGALGWGFYSWSS